MSFARSVGRPSSLFPLGCAVLAALAARPTSVAAQAHPSVGDAGVRWAASDGVAPLTISGIVLDASSGMPLPSAMIATTGDVGTLADESGRFELRLPSAGALMLRVELIGFVVEVDTLFVEPDRGLLAQINLRMRPVPICERMWCPDCPVAGVRVEVHDFRTGQAPTVPVLLKVEAGGRVDSVAASFPRDNKFDRPIAFAGGELGVDGPFRVWIDAPGYSTWTATGVWLQYENCAWSPLLHAWLLPS